VLCSLVGSELPTHPLSLSRVCCAASSTVSHPPICLSLTCPDLSMVSSPPTHSPSHVLRCLIGSDLPNPLALFSRVLCCLIVDSNPSTHLPSSLAHCTASLMVSYPPTHPPSRVLCVVDVNYPPTHLLSCAWCFHIIDGELPTHWPLSKDADLTHHAPFLTPPLSGIFFCL
jgi:hypothetical protein